MLQKSLALFLSVFMLVFSLSSCGFARSKQFQQADSVAMGSVVTIKAYGKTQKSTQVLLHSALQDVSALDSQILSKNLESAELYKLNHLEKKDKAPVSKELFEALSITQKVYSHSKGMAGIASGRLTELWGMDTDDFRVPTQEEIKNALPYCNDSNVFLHEDGTISFQNEQILNLGSVGKGMACDIAIERLKPAVESGQIFGIILSVGGSLGILGSPQQGKGEFRVGIRDPFGDANSYFASVSLQNTFLSTSGTYEKTFTENGKTYHHLLDLTNGYPKETDLVSVTVAAPSGLLSDALSTLCFLLGEKNSWPILKEYDAEAIFVYADRTVHMSDGFKTTFQLKDAKNSAFTVEEIS